MKLSEKIKQTMDQIEGEAKSRHYTGAEIKTMLNKLSQAAASDERYIQERPDDAACGCRGTICTDRVQRGDVFISKAFGGKVRPWVVLRAQADFVDATALSSSQSAPELVQSKCRYWPNSWLGSGFAAFTHEQATAEVTRPYTHLRHLDEVETAMLERLKPKPPVSVADIRNRIRRVSAQKEAAQ